MQKNDNSFYVISGSFLSKPDPTCSSYKNDNLNKVFSLKEDRNINTFLVYVYHDSEDNTKDISFLGKDIYHNGNVLPFEISSLQISETEISFLKLYGEPYNFVRVVLSTKFNDNAWQGLWSRQSKDNEESDLVHCTITKLPNLFFTDLSYQDFLEIMGSSFDCNFKAYTAMNSVEKDEMLSRAVDLYEPFIKQYLEKNKHDWLIINIKNALVLDSGKIANEPTGEAVYSLSEEKNQALLFFTKPGVREKR
jgi:hypothetical protein